MELSIEDLQYQLEVIKLAKNGKELLISTTFLDIVFGVLSLFKDTSKSVVVSRSTGDSLAKFVFFGV